MSVLPTILFGAILLVWPALLNRYPLVFSDTGGLLEMSLEPTIGWDKPWVYGPFMHLFHWHLTLWLPLVAQGILMSWMLWLTQTVTTRPRRTWHVALCAALALGTALPWFTAQLMPDLFTPITVLALFLLAYGRDVLTGRQVACVTIVATVAIASHLSNLVLAAACVAALGLLRLQLPWRPAVPLAAALGILLATNAVGNGVLGISPYGSVFALARLVADGPARTQIDAACPGAGYRLCAWQGRLPTDSDAFLWDPEGPVWANGSGPVLLAPEASRIVIDTIAGQPGAVLRSAAANTARQLTMVSLGDALGPDHLDVTVLPRLQQYFPDAEVGRYKAGLQSLGLLRPMAEAFNPIHLAVLGLGAVATAWLAVTRWRRDRALAALAVLVLVAAVANAFATGALSGPHDRYQARIAWLLVLPPLIYAGRLTRRADQAARAATASGDIRTNAS